MSVSPLPPRPVEGEEIERREPICLRSLLSSKDHICHYPASAFISHMTLTNDFLSTRFFIWEWKLYIYTYICIYIHTHMRAKLLQLCPTLVTHGLQPAMLLCPWDSPGKNTGVGCFSTQWYGVNEAKVSELSFCTWILWLERSSGNIFTCFIKIRKVRYFWHYWLRTAVSFHLFSSLCHGHFGDQAKLSMTWVTFAWSLMEYTCVLPSQGMNGF